MRLLINFVNSARLIILIAFLVSPNEAVVCDDKPAELEFMEPDACWFGPGIMNYDAMFECESELVKKINYAAYNPPGQICIMDCMLKEDDILKDMKLNRQKFLEKVKERSAIDFNTWKTAIETAVDKCFPLAEKKLATLNANSYDDSKNCNPIPKKLLTCINAQILLNSSTNTGALDDIYCTELKDFYKTCDFVF